MLVRHRHFLRFAAACSALAIAAALTACSVETSSTEAINPDQATVGEFLDASIPVEDNAAEAFFNKHQADCPNVDTSQHISSDFLDEIRTHALGADEADPIAGVFYEFCSKPPNA